MNEASPQKSELPDWSKGLLAATGALVVGVLAAVGVTGDLLARMVRNYPVWSAIPLAMLLLAGGALAVSEARKTKGKGRKVRIVASVAVPLFLIFEVVIGVASQLTRENPGVSLWVETADGQQYLHAEANGSGLVSDQRMLLQVVAVTGTAEVAGWSRVDDLRPVCRTTYGGAAPPFGVEVLSWEETGPDSSGAAQTQVALPVRPDAVLYCAYAALIAPDSWYEKLFTGGPQVNWAVLTVDAPPGE